MLLCQEPATEKVLLLDCTYVAAFFYYYFCAYFMEGENLNILI